MNRLRQALDTTTRTRLLLLAFLVLFTGLLAVMGVKGFYSRYAQDDYCYGYRFKTLGFWKGNVEAYFGANEFSSDRYSLSLFYGINEALGGTSAVPFLPAAEIIALTAGLSFLVFRLLKGSHRVLFAIAAAMCITFFTLFLAPDQYQILYWLSAIHTYLTPVVFTVWILGRMLVFTQRGRFTVLNGIELLILGIVAGGFSETTWLWQFTIWVITLLVLYLFRRATLFKTAKAPLITVLVAFVISAVILVLNPSNLSRGSHWVHPSILSIIAQPLFFGEEFIRTSLKATPLPFAFVTAFGALLRIIKQDLPTLRGRKYPAQMGMTLAVVYILSVVTMVPYWVIMHVYPGDRGLLPAHFTLVAGLFFLGWLAGGWFLALRPAILSRPVFQWATVLAGLFLAAYLVRTVPRVYDKMPLHAARAHAWDLRQQMIYADVAKGEKNIEVPQFDSIYGITELRNGDYWINQCAAKYYGVDSLTAVDGYLGVPAYPIER